MLYFDKVSSPMLRLDKEKVVSVLRIVILKCHSAIIFEEHGFQPLSTFNIK